MNRLASGVAAVVILAGCAAGGESYRRAWVDPSTVQDRAAYERDLEECRLKAKAAFDEHRATSRTVGMEAATGGAALVAGGLLLGPVGAIAGGATGATLAGTPSLQQSVDHLYATNRNCLRERGYTPLQ